MFPNIGQILVNAICLLSKQLTNLAKHCSLLADI